MRNNEERIGAKPSAGFPTSADAPKGPLDFVVPTDYVEIPSKGKFYPKGHPLCGVDTVEIKHMTAKEEDILNNKALLKKGTAVDRALQNLLIDPRLSVDNILVGDKNAIMVAARIDAYGPLYNSAVVCPSCEERSEFEYDLSKTTLFEGKNTDELDGVTITDNGLIEIELPVSKFKVVCQFVYGEQEQKLQQTRLNNKKKKLNVEESGLLDQLRMIVVGINDVEDRGAINRAITNLPARDTRHLRQMYHDVVPSIEMKHKFKCDFCEYEVEVNIPLTSEFFWPKQ